VADALVVTARSGSDPLQLSGALLIRSLSLHGLSSVDRAIDDLAEARRLIPQVGDPAINESLSAEAETVEGRIFVTREPERAAAALERALDYHERATPVWVPGLRQLLARTQAARGLDDAAAAELEAGIRVIEAQRTSFRGDPLQVAFFDQAASLFDDMVVLQVDKRHDPQRALSYVERGRARQLVDSLGSGANAATSSPASTAKSLGRPLGPEELQRAVPDGVAMIYYMSEPQRLLVWVLTHERLQMLERPLAQDRLRRTMAAHAAALEQNASRSVVSEEAALLFDELVRPVLPALRSTSAWILIPDELVQRVPFAGLWDRQAGRYLVEDRLIAMAPSGTVFVRTSAAPMAPTSGRHPRLLVVGNPRLARGESSRLPSLPGAEAEADDVAKLYTRAEVLIGSAATKKAVLEGMRHSEVIHFAGHAEPGEPLGAPARLLLAPDAESGASGSLFAHDITGSILSRTQVVVLAGCRTRPGETSSEGSLSIARPFLASGVRSVIATLWDVDDAVSRRFSVTFHRNLLADGDAALAMQHTQAAFLRAADPSLAHPASWAGFVVLGGLDHRKVASPPRSAGSL
jgi:CHAT domain-containing protein